MSKPDIDEMMKNDKTDDFNTLHNVSDYNKTLITNLFKRRVQ